MAAASARFPFVRPEEKSRPFSHETRCGFSPHGQHVAQVRAAAHRVTLGGSTTVSFRARDFTFTARHREARRRRRRSLRDVSASHARAAVKGVTSPLCVPMLRVCARWSRRFKQM
ncbi:hypothetical protein GN956_G9701 [Arapaima gigas]